MNKDAMDSSAKRKLAFLLSPLVLGPVLLCYPLVSLLMSLGFRAFPVAYVAYVIAGLLTVVVVLALLRAMGYTLADLGWKGFKSSHIALGLGGAAIAAVMWWGITAFTATVGLPSWGTSFRYTNPIWQVPLVFALCAVVGPFVEEVLFRGFILTAWNDRFGPVAAWIASIVFFALLHYIPFGIGAVILIVPWSIIPSLLAWKTKSLWPAFIMHMANNALAYVLFPLMR